MAPISRRLLPSAVLHAAIAMAAASYCVPGQAIPLSPLPGCRWYAASRACGGAGVALAPLLLPVPLWHVKDACCRELAAVPAECRCRALRAMAEETPAAVVGRACWLAQARFAPTVVAETECGLRTVHGIRFCYARGAEDNND
ncbi:hypothetical protein C2845_PM02G24660 [Panicum miliaceum]|uniref:Bifunctional inhibitor/plant lipid transfer protein/seed storage helical domain-containing protein n=1 Tax=Panicum miliaceum TaxID=4540 RepID=A0A3L6SB47_PANMI|nr:hypothetical protein C2845_PM02G24660 [Panicum miliaceum]